jgi:hypothetical protein
MRSEARGRRGRAGTRARSVASRCWKWAVSVTVLVTVLLAEYGFLHERIAADVAELVAGNARTPQAEMAVPPVPAAPAPAAAGDVATVQVRALSPCSPKTSCAVRVHVGLVPRPSPVLVRWEVRIEDVCSGGKATVVSGSVTVPPRADRADVVDRFVLPAGSALAVTAVTTSPAVAAGAPLWVPTRPSCSSDRKGET